MLASVGCYTADCKLFMQTIKLYSYILALSQLSIVSSPDCNNWLVAAEILILVKFALPLGC